MSAVDLSLKSRVAQIVRGHKLVEDERIRELAMMTDDEARRISLMLLAPIPNLYQPDWRKQTSGLVELQRIFSRARPPL